ncbi:MAG: hypothetical protein M1834_001935 [Cirrosporium novae-zelandiae]|nr:MAG: hypothetical protein M1834_001935 [Cirrosporium novae-zelandiae]
MADQKNNTNSRKNEIHIQYATDEEAANSPRPKLSRQNSSLSIHSIRPHRNTIDPSTIIPPVYRTISIGLEESKERDILELKKAKQEFANLDWHRISPHELCIRLSTSIKHGLSDNQVHRRLEDYGKNAPSLPPTHLFQKAFQYFFGGFGSVLLTASILVFVCWKPLGNPPAVANLALAIVLLAVFFIQAAFNAWQDWSSSRVMASITKLLPDMCLVIRNSSQIQTDPLSLVPGDVLLIKAGNKLSADVRFVEISPDAKFDRSIMTGESKPTHGSVDSTDDNYLETHCIGLQGTHCISGTGIGIVISTGDRTVFGRIAKLTSQPNLARTTLQKEILRFVVIICSLMLIMIIIVAIVWATWIRKAHPNWISVPELIVDCVSIAVAFIPEGLPIALTASLTICANIMRQNKILCKSLKTVETLGAVSVICSDKTGTLTKNEMWVTECVIGTQTMCSEAIHDEFLIEARTPNSPKNSLSQFRAATALCNAGEFDASTANQPLSEKRINGDATDQAILRFSEGLGPVSTLRRMWKKVFEISFNSKNKFMVRVFETDDLDGPKIALAPEETFDMNNLLFTIKGAPDVLIGRCDKFIQIDGTVHSLDLATLSKIEALKDEWSSQGKRVILLARKILDRSAINASPTSRDYEKVMMHHAASGLTLIGLVGIIDPPRDEIPDVVDTLRRAGIRIFMVTGDFKLTAQAIATECGIITNSPAMIDDVSALSRNLAFIPPERSFPECSYPFGEGPVSSIVLSGPELQALNEAQWEQLASYTEIVFARTTPEQKLRIVKEFKARHNIVAMTGDGVNDSPSLKEADIGIALGSGSDIAIEAADMVLMESFDAIVQAVLYGRVVFDNLKKTIAYLLPAGSFSEFWPVFTNVLFGLPQVLSSFLMIVICCFTDCAAATSLAYEKPEFDVMLRPPRDPRKDRLVDWKLILQSYGFVGVIETIASFAMSYWYLERKGITFSVLWFGFGEIPTGMTEDYYTARLNEASSIYFINLVVM